MQDCADGTGDLAGFLSAPYTAADLESIRVALGEEQLDYLGYSYGTIIGATFAADHPDRVGHFVLDGTTDPLVGGDDGVIEDGFPYYADRRHAARRSTASPNSAIRAQPASVTPGGAERRGHAGSPRRTRLHRGRPPDR